MIIIKSPQTRDEFKAYYALRYHVLREPLGLPHGTEKMITNRSAIITWRWMTPPDKWWDASN